MIDDLATLWYYLTQGDLWGFIQAIYVTRLGEVFWGLILLTLSVVIYARFESFTYVIILWLLMASLGFLAAAPHVSLLAVALMALGIIGVFYKTVWRNN